MSVCLITSLYSMLRGSPAVCIRPVESIRTCTVVVLPLDLHLGAVMLRGVSFEIQCSCV